LNMDNKTFRLIIDKLENTTDKDGKPLNMDSVIISEGSTFYRHKFKDEHLLNDLRSISKPVLCMALGIAIEKGLFLRGTRVDLDTRIWPFFEERVSLKSDHNLERLNKITLRHVLTHTMGYAEGFMFSKDIKDRDPNTLLDYIFNTDLVYDPGERFIYTNVGPYVISALIHEELDINAAKWVEELLFQKIGIVEYEWKNYGKYCAGSSGLRLSNNDLHKVGLILIHDGYYDQNEIVPKHWINSMRTVQVLTPNMYDEKRVFPKYGYGFYIYICKNGDYYCDGTDGQYLIVLPKREIVITTFGHQSDMKPITECFRMLL
jgi:CubicO group peptidase (beta-lactamase class C family)